MSTYNWDRLNPFSPPASGDLILLPSGTYTLIRGMDGWSLYREGDNTRHPLVQDIDAMTHLMAQVYRVGNREEFEQR